MAKLRVYELAKELGLDNKEIMARLREIDVPVKSHMSVVPDDSIEKIKKSMSEEKKDVAEGGVEEKRVGSSVIRRRSRPAKPSEEAEQQAKVDLESLKQATRRARREEEEAHPKPEEGAIEDIPEEWTQEEAEEKEAKAKKKPAAKKKAAAKKKPAKKAPAEKEEVKKAAKKKKKPEVEEPPPPREVPEKEKARPKKRAAKKPEKKAPEKPAPEKEPRPQKLEAEAEKAPPKPRRIYMRPQVRKTARAPEGEPLPVPGKMPEKKPVEPAPPSPEAAVEKPTKKKKKKNKSRETPEDVSPELYMEAAPKKRLRRKIAFKIQKGMEGMELADIEQMYMPSRKKVSGKKKAARKTKITTPKAIKRIVKMEETITVAEFARQLGAKSRDIIKALKNEGVEAGEYQVLDAETAGIIASLYDYEVSQELFDEEQMLAEEQARPERMKPRPPVVTVMGHVDHGKTSLLDLIRKTRVTEEESGAITQHIGASVVETDSGKITFVDTPGHEAFTAMRMRGAQVTDIVVLVVAADDGIMPQTVEAADHAKNAGVPIVVAINKIDLPDANTQRIKQRLSEIGLTPDEWGGENLVVECSAKTGRGIPDLLEAILLQAEILELTADPEKTPKGFVIETRLDKGKGPVATMLVKEGTLEQGQVLLAGEHYGKVRAMIDDSGNQVKSAGPSSPVEVLGLSGVPEPGEQVIKVADEKKARLVAHKRMERKRGEEVQEKKPKVSLEDIMERLQQGEVEELRLVLKADTQGSVEAIKQSAQKLGTEEVKVEVIHSGAGNITENDVLLASASSAVIVGFTVKPETKAAKLAEQETVEIRTYDIIYNLLDDLEASVKGLLKPRYEEHITGRAEVRKVFRISKVGAVAGSYVVEGSIKRNAPARVIRDNEVVHSGKVKSIKREQEDAREVTQGLECGINVDNFNDVHEGDIIEAYEVTEVPR